MSATASDAAGIDPGRPFVTGSAHPHPGSRSLGWWGLVVLIASEATLFGLLLFVNFYLRVNADRWPLGDFDDPELALSSIRTVILLGSSIPAMLADRAARRGDQHRFRLHVGITFAMAAIFLAGHVQEYLVMLPELSWNTNAYGSVFYTVTGLHALHLVFGMAVLIYLYVQSWRGRFDGRLDRPSVTCGILYWHFVDVVWIAVYGSLYLSVSLL